MAAAALKQPCPSCEHEVAVKDSQVGKKIECPKCKYKFLVQKPTNGKGPKPDSKPDAKAKSDPGKVDPKAEKAKADAKTDPKAKKTKPGSLRDVDDDSYPSEKKPRSKKNLQIGIGLAVVGVLLLVGAYVFIFNRGGGGPKKGNQTVRKDLPEPVEDVKDGPKDTPKVDVTKKEPPKLDTTPVHLPGPQQTNLLPNDTEHVFHGFFRDIFDALNPLRDKIVGDPHVLLDAVFKPKIGFGISDVDDFIRAERFTGTPWTYTVIHLRTPVDQAALTDVYGLQAMPAIKEMTYHKITKQNPWFDQLARMTLGVPHWLRSLPREERPLFIRFHDANTFIVANEGPIQELLKNGGEHFPLIDAPVAKKERDNSEIVAAVKDSKWIGAQTSKTPPQDIELVFKQDGVANISMDIQSTPGTYEIKDSTVTATFGQTRYVGDIRLTAAGYEIIGGVSAKDPTGKELKFKFSANRIGAADTIVAKKEKATFLTGTKWAGAEKRPPGNGKVFGPLVISFLDGNKMSMDTPAGRTGGEYKLENNGTRVVIEFGPNFRYEGDLKAAPNGSPGMEGKARFDNLLWPFAVVQVQSESDPIRKVNVGEGKVILPQIRSRSYLTIKLRLKEVLDRMEAKIDEAQDKCLYSTATELDAARVPAAQMPPEYRGRFAWRGKQVWDLANLLDERKPRIVIAGSGLVERDPKIFQYRAEFDCDTTSDARDVHNVTETVLAAEVARNFERYLRLKIDYPQPMEKPLPGQQPPVVPQPPPPQPMPVPGGDPLVPPLPDTSKWVSSMRDESVDVRVDLVFKDHPEVYRQMQELVHLFAIAARSEVDLVADPRGRHILGQAAVAVAKNGIPDRKVPPGTFPPGVFPRPGAVTKGANSPYYRLSWMTSLLPYLGSDALANRIDYTSSWRDPSNWLAGRTIVPEFLDPSYPIASRHVAVPGMGVDPAATHVVGIAGVGLDAADYQRNDPATIKKRGIFGYDRSVTLTEIGQGRGAGSTIMMMQIPHDGLTGVSPWIAGGGSTLRGIPEKKSIDPFVLSTDKNGKPITHGGKKGTFAIMADGSVKFIDATISDDVLKAMATLHGPTAGEEEKVIAVPDPTQRIEPKTALPKVQPKTAPKTEVAPPPDEKKK